MGFVNVIAVLSALRVKNGGGITRGRKEMTKKDLEQENARLREGLERIREITDNPRKYVKKEFPDLSGSDEYAVCIGVISSISAFALTGVID